MIGKHIINGKYEYRTDNMLGAGAFAKVYKGE